MRCSPCRGALDPQRAGPSSSSTTAISRRRSTARPSVTSRTWTDLRGRVTSCSGPITGDTAALKARPAAPTARRIILSMCSTRSLPSNDTPRPTRTASVCGAIRWAGLSRCARWSSHRISRRASSGAAWWVPTRICWRSGGGAPVHRRPAARPAGAGVGGRSWWRSSASRSTTRTSGERSRPTTTWQT